MAGMLLDEFAIAYPSEGNSLGQIGAKNFALLFSEGLRAILLTDSMLREKGQGTIGMSECSPLHV